ncbi:MAG: 50S ribosomal protein L22 [Candidatus Woesearchaeota archaeon]|nr:50S ribosomal protein L22 [Candidatus Woesearchaeota archaeon]
MKYRYAIKNLDKKKTAKAVGKSVYASAKHAKEVCDMIRSKKANRAVILLQDAIDLKKVVPYKKFHRDLAHKRKIGPGRYPVKTCREVLSVLNGAIANAENKGLNKDDLYIKHVCSHIASRPWHYGRHRGRKMKRAHVEIVLEEKDIKKTQKKSKSKKSSKKKQKSKKKKSKPKKQTKKKSKSPDKVTKKQEKQTDKKPGKKTKKESKSSDKNTKKQDKKSKGANK